MWVARDKNGVLLLFRFFPKRLIDLPCWRRDNNTIVLDSDLFPELKELKWEDEPIEIHLLTDLQIAAIQKEAYKNGYDSGYDNCIENEFN